MRFLYKLLKFVGYVLLVLGVLFFIFGAVLISRNEITCFNTQNDNASEEIVTSDHPAQIEKYLNWVPYLEAFDQHSLENSYRQKQYSHLHSIRAYWDTLCGLSKTSIEMGTVNKEPKFKIYAKSLNYTFQKLVSAVNSSIYGNAKDFSRSDATGSLRDNIWRATLSHLDPSRNGDEEIHEALRQLSDITWGGRIGLADSISKRIKLNYFLFDQFVFQNGHDIYVNDIRIDGLTRYQLENFFTEGEIEVVGGNLVVSAHTGDELERLLENVIKGGGRVNAINDKMMLLISSTEVLNADPLFVHTRADELDPRYLYQIGMDQLNALLKSKHIEHIFP